MIITGTIPEAQNPNVRTQAFADRRSKYIYFLCDRASYKKMQAVYARNNITNRSRILRVKVCRAIDLSYAVNQTCRLKIKLIKHMYRGIKYKTFVFADLDVIY